MLQDCAVASRSDLWPGGEEKDCWYLVNSGLLRQFLSDIPEGSHKKQVVSGCLSDMSKELCRDTQKSPEVSC